MLKRWILGKEQNMKRTSVIWNALGGALNAGQAAIILIFISYRQGLTVAGMVTIAYAVANLFLSICKYGIRNYQVTDVKEKFTFSDYFYCRCCTTLLTLGLFFIYLAYCFILRGYSVEKGIILCEVTILKLLDAFEDVYIGRYQQTGRLDVGAKIMAVRLFVSTALICILVLAGADIYISLLGGIVSSVILDIYLIKSTFGVTRTVVSGFQWSPVRKLLKICLPLCIGITLSIYIGNVPKYMIDAYMGEEVQAVFGYIMMPVFVITLLNQFIYQPMVKDLGDIWEKKDKKEFSKSVCRQCLIVTGLTVVVIVGGQLLGLPILSVLYNVDLTAYQTEFAVLLLGGGFYAVAYYLNVPITTIRKQNYIAIGYVVAAILSVIFGKYFVLAKGMLGAALLYLCINALLVVVYSVILAVGVKDNELTEIDV